MTLRFDLDMDDMTVLRKQSVKKNGNLTVYICAFVVLLLCVVRVRNDSGFAALIFTVFAFMFILIPVFHRNETVKALHSMFLRPGNRTFFGEREIIIGEESIETTTQWGRKGTKWNGTVKAGETEGYIFLFLSGITAIVFPFHKPTQPEVEELNTLLQKHVPACQEQKQK